MLIKIKVIPKAKLNKIEKISDTEYRLWVTASPDKGKANQAVIETLADELGVAKSKIEIITGLTNREKLIKVNYNNCA